MRSRSLGAVAFLLSVASLAWAQNPNPVFLFAPVGAGAALEVPAGVLRQRFVGIDFAGLEEVRAQVESVAGGALRLNLFDDAAFEAVVTDTGPTSAGYWLTGHLAGKELTSVTLVVNGEVVAGTVRAPGGTYTIRGVGNELYAVRQLDPATLRHFRSDTRTPSGSPPPPSVFPAPPPARPPAGPPPGRPGWPRSGRLRPRLYGRPRRRRPSRTARASTSSSRSRRRPGPTKAAFAPSGR